MNAEIVRLFAHHREKHFDPDRFPHLQTFKTEGAKKLPTHVFQQMFFGIHFVLTTYFLVVSSGVLWMRPRARRRPPNGAGANSVTSSSITRSTSLPANFSFSISGMGKSKVFFNRDPEGQTSWQDSTWLFTSSPAS